MKEEMKNNSQIANSWGVPEQINQIVEKFEV